MHPAFSVIFFTVTSGAGYGLLAFTALLGIVNTATIIDSSYNQSFVIAVLSGAALVILGLLSSTFHLSNPKNAWRSLFRFKSSWLSREAVFAILSFPLAAAFLISFWFFNNQFIVQFFATLLILIAIMTVFATGMIYACLKTIKAWNSPLVPLNYILLGLLSGNIILIMIMSYFKLASSVLEISLMLLLAISAISKIIYYLFIGQPSQVSIKTATGLSGKTVRLLDTGESSDNFLTKEFGYVVAKNKILLLRIIAFFMMFIVPAILLFIDDISSIEITVLMIINYLGSMIERWLFFAEGKHIVNLFYGRKI